MQIPIRHTGADLRPVEGGVEAVLGRGSAPAWRSESLSSASECRPGHAARHVERDDHLAGLATLAGRQGVDADVRPGHPDKVAAPQARVLGQVNGPSHLNRAGLMSASVQISDRSARYSSTSFDCDRRARYTAAVVLAGAAAFSIRGTVDVPAARRRPRSAWPSPGERQAGHRGMACQAMARDGLALAFSARGSNRRPSHYQLRRRLRATGHPGGRPDTAAAAVETQDGALAARSGFRPYAALKAHRAAVAAQGRKIGREAAPKPLRRRTRWARRRFSARHPVADCAHGLLL